MLQSDREELSSLYDSFWDNAVQGFVREGVQTDPYLGNRQADRRRGLTVVARPSPAVRDRITHFLRRIASVTGDQYVYTPESFHLTILSLFTATEQFEPYYEQLPAYQSAVERVLVAAKPFTVAFRGITASQNSIMVQGFPHNDELNQLREALRSSVREAGLGGGLDKRYRIKTAHMTVVRFQSQPVDIQGMVGALREYREHDFGEMPLDTIELVKNDWYMSPDRVEVVARYSLH